MNEERKAADFRGESRIHVGFTVRDLDASLAFYETLLGAPPVKVRPGYAKFEPAEPSVNLSIHTSSRLANRKVVSTGTHYGVQVKSTEAVTQAQKRLHEAGYATKVEAEATCCYAVQDKVWARDPDGNDWEVFVVLDADAPVMRDASVKSGVSAVTGDDAKPAAAESPCCDDTCCSDLERTENVKVSVSTQDQCC
ncbi:MAG: glyoxalase/bleomycin resistance/dioxygenase family protein [Gemmatimonadetes bacterium]|nr:glyoxalase/bleomycin resistance/dioxygenase family protein [Gemmatimonadota bacterium]